MSDLRLDLVRLVILDSNRQVRQALVSHLFHHGFRDMADTERLSDVEERLATDTVDLLIATTGEGGDLSAAALLRKSRRQDVGKNPFVVAILVLATATEDTVRAALDAGPDAILASPVSVGDLYKRVMSLMRERKPFVVTSDYTGPERRKDGGHHGGEEIPLIPAPNPLRTKATGQGLAGLGRQIANTAEILKGLRIERAARQILYVGSRLPSLPKEDDRRPAVLADFHRMKAALSDLRQRLAATPYAALEPAAAELATVLESLGGDPTGAAAAALTQAARLSEGLYQATEELHRQARKAVRPSPPDAHAPRRNQAPAS